MQKWDHESVYPVSISGDAGKMLTVPRIKDKNKNKSEWLHTPDEFTANPKNNFLAQFKSDGIFSATIVEKQSKKIPKTICLSFFHDFLSFSLLILTHTDNRKEHVYSIGVGYVSKTTFCESVLHKYLSGRWPMTFMKCMGSKRLTFLYISYAVLCLLEN